MRAEAAVEPVIRRRRAKEADDAAHAIARAIPLSAVADAPKGSRLRATGSDVVGPRRPAATDAVASEREGRERQFRENRAVAVRKRLADLRDQQIKEQLALARSQQEQTATLLRSILEEDKAAAAALREVYADALSPARHGDVMSLLQRFC